MTTMIRKAMGFGLAVAMVVGAAAAAAAQTVSRLEAYTSTVWTAPVARGELVRVVVDGDGDTDLDVYVYQDGYLLAADDDETDYCVAVFRAPRSGPIQVRVVNRGSVWNRYSISIR